MGVNQKDNVCSRICKCLEIYIMFPKEACDLQNYSNDLNLSSCQEASASEKLCLHRQALRRHAVYCAEEGGNLI